MEHEQEKTGSGDHHLNLEQGSDDLPAEVAVDEPSAGELGDPLLGRLQGVQRVRERLLVVVVTVGRPGSLSRRS